jgi:hypothetical protein
LCDKEEGGWGQYFHISGSSNFPAEGRQDNLVAKKYSQSPRPKDLEMSSMAEKSGFFGIGRKNRRYVRFGRLLLWWYGFRRNSELCAVWWPDSRRRVAKNGMTVKPPWRAPLYSEGYGRHRPFFRLFGWRLLPVSHESLS